MKHRRTMTAAAWITAAALLAVAGCGGEPEAPTGESEIAEAALALHREHFERATTLYSQGELQEALSQAARALVASPQNPDTYALISQIYIELGDDEGALGFFEIATRNYADLDEPWYYRGYHLFRLDKWAEALEAFEKASEIDPEDPRHHFRQGLIRQTMGDFEGAQASLGRANELDPSDAITAARYSRVLRVSGDYDEAERVVSEALAASPDSSDLHYALGQLRLRQGKDAEAEAAFRRAIAISPNRSDAHHDLSRLLTRTGREDEGRRERLRAERLRDYADVQLSLSRLFSARPDDPEVVLALAELELTEHNPASAMRWLSRAENLVGVNDRVAGLRVETAVMIGDPEGARVEATRLADSSDPRALLARSTLALASGEWSEGLRLLEDAVATAPEDRCFLRRAADLYERVGKNEEFEALVNRAAAVEWKLAAEAAPGMRSAEP
jgi:tetratricopeptide (TPR) repeat protein